MKRISLIDALATTATPTTPATLATLATTATLATLATLAALAALTLSCAKQEPAVEPGGPEGLRFETDTLYFQTAQQEIILKSLSDSITTFSYYSKVKGWDAQPINEKGDFCITSPQKGADCPSKGNMTLKGVGISGEYYYSTVYVELTDPRELAHPVAVFMGDSIFELWGSQTDGDAGFFTANNYKNVGKSGDTTLRMLKRFASSAINNHGDILVLCGGTNDIAMNDGRFVSDATLLGNLEAMCDSARNDGSKILLCSLFPTDGYYWKTSVKPAQRIKDLNTKIQALVQEKGYDGYVDFYTPLADSDGGFTSKYSDDGVHPNQSCYKEVLNDIVKAAIDAVRDE